MKSGQTNAQVPSGSTLRVSVIIPTLNEERVIGRCLEALERNTIPKDAFEVIVVDNGSKDKTVETALRFNTVFSLKVLSLKGAHISAIRNYGASEARGEILAFLDADCLAPPNWLSEATRIFEDHPQGIIGAHYRIPDDATWVGRTWYQDRMSERIGSVSYVPSGDLLIRRELFANVRGFDESIQTNEDFELCQRVIRAGWPVRAYLELRVVHLGTPRSLIGFFRKQRWHGTHVLTVFLRDPQKRSNMRPVLLSFYILTCLIGLSTGVIFGAVNGIWWVCGAFALVLVTPLVALALLRSAISRRWNHAFPLAVLYLAFGVARASCLLNYGAWKLSSEGLASAPLYKERFRGEE